MNSKIFKLTQELFLNYQDRSSKSSIENNNRLFLTTENWEENKMQFIEERFSGRRQQAWTKQEWAKAELEFIEGIEYHTPDRRILKERYSKELARIIKVRGKEQEQEIGFKWIAEDNKLKTLYKGLKEGGYIQDTKRDFEQLFNGNKASAIKPITWKATQWELGRFVELLVMKSFISASFPLKKIAFSFIDKNGNKFNITSMKSQRSEAKRSIAGSAEKEEKLIALICSLEH